MILITKSNANTPVKDYLSEITLLEYQNVITERI